MGQITKYTFYILLILIVVVYWTGSTNVLGTMGDAVNKLVLSLSGRKTNGEFANYPK